ncbi:MAG: peroxiredoxin [Pseudomonadota bacterium]
MLKTGAKAPEFVLPDDSGEEVSLSDLLQDGPLVLYFYPADFTPGCTKEACAIRDIHDDLLSVGLNIVGVSPQDAASHTTFREKYELPFTLLSDVDKTVVNMFGVDGPLGIGVRRATFLIAQDRRIQDAIVADIRIGRHTDFLRKAVKLRETAGLKKREA